MLTFIAVNSKRRSKDSGILDKPGRTKRMTYDLTILSRYMHCATCVDEIQHRTMSYVSGMVQLDPSWLPHLRKYTLRF